MRPEPSQLATLGAIITEDIVAVERLNAELSQLVPSLDVPKPAFRDMAAVAYVLHNVYCALENAFEQISRTFENHITDPAQWHRELLAKMFLDIPTVRPAVLPTGLRGFLNDLRGFRHLFRHSYDFQLDPEKLNRLVRDWTAARLELLAALSRFRDNLIVRAGTSQ
jgi:uncharacterized protein YutE (UPF0331/DUF86 family)